MDIYYFNPDNDLALASGAEHYSPTPVAEQLRRDLQLLPCWIANPGDCVLCNSKEWQSWVNEHGFGVRLITKEDLPTLNEATFRPWGWNPSMRWRLLHWGAKEEYLPTSDQMELWRNFSHRRTSILIHDYINDDLGMKLCPTPVELTKMPDIMYFAHRYPGCYVKEPWSGSGRGIYRALDPDGRDFIQRCQGALNRQGSVLCEVPFDRTLDFAVEMECNNGHTSITGYSIFESDFHLQYKHGLVRPSEELKDIITAQYPDFHQVEDALVKAIKKYIAPHYCGYLGIDMLLYRNTNGSIGINPCVELNLRTTMGAVTAALGERCGMRGRFSICHIKDIRNDDIVLTHADDDTKFAAVIRKD